MSIQKLMKPLFLQMAGEFLGPPTVGTLANELRGSLISSTYVGVGGSRRSLLDFGCQNSSSNRVIDNETDQNLIIRGTVYVTTEILAETEDVE